MGLRARLAAFFIAIAVIPLTVAVLGLQVQLRDRLAEVGDGELSLAGAAARGTFNAVRDRLGDLAAELGRTDVGNAIVAGDADEVQNLVERVFDATSGRADFLVVLDAEGEVLGDVVVDPEFTGGAAATPTAADIAEAVTGSSPVPGALTEIRVVRGDGNRRLGWIAAGVWADAQLLQLLPEPRTSALIGDGTVLAAAGESVAQADVAALPSRRPTELRLDEQPVRALAVPIGDERAPGSVRLLLWREPAGRPGIGLAVVALLVTAVLLAAAVGWFLASGVVAPVDRAARVARAVTAGDLDQSLEPTGGPELAALAGALNTMSAELSRRMEQLSASRDQLRQSLSRLGMTLSSSLDLDRTLAVVVETAIETLGGDRGMLWLFTPERDALYVKVGRGVGQDLPRLPVGAGVAGHVARVGVPLRLPADRETVPLPSEEEPSADHALAVPMVGRGRVLGVLTILGDDPDRGFTQDDLDTLRSFAAQASVAMENVMLHQEAQRLSVTDPLTGLWNFRYFQLQAERELESAARFERPLSLLIIDLDHFKTVNDRFGHQVGDDVLIEIARRIQGATRVPDVVARYGGEEFVVLLPGTDLDGAIATAERIRGAVSASKVVSTSTPDIPPMSVTCSVGVAEHPRHGGTVGGLLRSADAAMYQAKSQGRDRVAAAGAGGPQSPSWMSGRPSAH